jgi:hypothetical protein
LNVRAFRSKLNSDGIVRIPDELTWISVEDKGKIYVLGDRTYINSAYSQVNEIAISNGYELRSTPLTPDLEKFEGWGLVEIELDKFY